MNEEQEGLWWTWNQGKKPDDLSTLVNTFTPMMKSQMRRIGNETIPPSAIEGEAKSLTIQAIRSYKPEEAASLSTHVGNRLKKLDRYVMQRQGVGRLPEEQILRTATFRQAEGEMEDDLGRTPTAQELSDKLQWSLGQVARTRRGLKGEFVTSANPLLEELNPTHREQFDVAVAMQFVYQDLEPEQQRVFEFTFGHAGQDELKTNREIADKMGISESKVRNVKTKILGQLEPFLGDR